MAWAPYGGLKTHRVYDETVLLISAGPGDDVIWGDDGTNTAAPSDGGAVTVAADSVKPDFRHFATIRVQGAENKEKFKI